MEGLFFLVNKRFRVIEYAGDLPEMYGRIATPLHDMNYESLKDLSWASHPDMGFLTEADARAAGVPGDVIDSIKASAWGRKWQELEATRSELIEAIRWRVDRHDDEVRMKKPPTDNIDALMKYIDAIREIKKSYPDPYSVVWPQVP